MQGKPEEAAGWVELSPQRLNPGGSTPTRFETDDLQEAAFLAIHGHEPTLVFDRHGSALWVCDWTDEVEQLHVRYSQDDMLFRLKHALNRLKRNMRSESRRLGIKNNGPQRGDACLQGTGR